MSDQILLLTACVKPNGMAFTYLQNEELRLEQYKNALHWYLDNTELKIVFVENTQTDFSNDFQEYINTGRLEYITFDGNNYDRNLGKGYGEALILKKALEKSNLIKEDSIIIKITGRLVLCNINKFVSKVERDNIYINTSLINGRCLCYSYVFICPQEFIKKYFLPKMELLDDSNGFFFEHLLFDSLILWEKNKQKHKEFLFPLKLDGISGTTGEVYYFSGKLNTLKSIIKYILHRYKIYYNYLQ